MIIQNDYANCVPQLSKNVNIMNDADPICMLIQKMKQLSQD